MNELVKSEKIVDLYGGEKHLEIWTGDVLACEGETVDFLILSSFPNDYLPTSRSLVGQLSEAGINVAEVACHKERDWRPKWFCWLSKELTAPRVPIGRLVC